MPSHMTEITIEERQKIAENIMEDLLSPIVPFLQLILQHTPPPAEIVFALSNALARMGLTRENLQSKIESPKYCKNRRIAKLVLLKEYDTNFLNYMSLMNTLQVCMQQHKNMHQQVRIS